tara:strand:+ start:440 stop:883 length:444 start_codon:yes stop_codon:yes gene_type:complete
MTIEEHSLPYKTIDGQKYIVSFPNTWIKSENISAGPINCSNCELHGCVNDIFIGYCLNCATHIYKGERGNGYAWPNETYMIDVDGETLMNIPSDEVILDGWVEKYKYLVEREVVVEINKVREWSAEEINSCNTNKFKHEILMEMDEI